MRDDGHGAPPPGAAAGLSDRRRLAVVLSLGTTQTIAWASSYYLPAILAAPMARALAITATEVFAAFSVALLVAALLGPRVGRTIDAIGGRGVLMISNLLYASGLLLMAVAGSRTTMWIGWLTLGAGMGLGLYDAAFAALGRIFGMEARGPITGITLMAGFASTIGWPLSALGLDLLGWRGTCAAWALVHLLVALPMNRLLLPLPAAAPAAHASDAKPHIPMDTNMWLLGFAFAAGWVISTAMAVHLPMLLEHAGATTAQAIAAGALIGPAQVAARLAEATLMQRRHPLTSARLSAALHPLGAALIAIGLPGSFPLFAVLHGAGNGILTIARGTVPLAIYGPVNYGYRLGILGAPSRIAQASAPLGFGLLIEHLGLGVLAVSAGLGLATLAAFSLVRPPADAPCKT